MRALAFPDSRRDQIQGDIGETFQWITSYKPFTQWLNSTDGIYHISGKPGSGKSTIIKFIDGNTDVHKRLNQWAQLDNKALLKASFYAWKPTSDAFEWKPEDHSCTELLIRSLLHQLLTSAPKHIQTVFSQHWNPARFTVFNTKIQSDDSKPRLSFSELQTALHELLEKHLAHSYRIFLLIDAMDEFGHTYAHEQLAKTVQGWSQCSPENIKICVSSREENPFLNTFPAQQRLQLHLHTTHDIEKLVKARLYGNPYFQSTNFKEEHRKEMVRAIVKNAQGVFIWVVFTINELLLLLADRQDYAALKEVVDTFRGEELNDFFKQIFNRIPRRYHQEARAVFSVVGTVSAHPIREHFCLLHYAAISKCGIPSATWPESNSGQTLPQQAAHAVRNFKSRLPTISRGMLELDYIEGTFKRSLFIGQHSNEGLRFIHRSVYDFFKDNPGALVNTSHEELTIDSLTLILRSFIRVLKPVIPPNMSDHGYIFVKLISDLLQLVDKEGRDSTGDIRPSYLRCLREFDIALFRMFGVLSSDKDFESCVESDLKLRPAFPFVFQVGIASRDIWYGRWALDGNYPSWIRSDSVKDYVLDGIFKDHEAMDKVLLYKLVNAVRSGYIDLNEPARCLPPPHRFSPQIRGSLWLNHCIRSLLSQCPYLYNWGMLILEFNPEPRIKFRWWSEGYTQPQDANDVPWGKNQESWIATGKDLDGVDVGERFGVIVTVGDDREGQLIQGPQWLSERHDTRIIRLLIFNFGTTSGEATLRDILDKMLTPSDKEEISMERQRQDRDLALQALDEALVVKESAAMLATTNEELKGEEGNGDLTLGGLQTREERAWKGGDARSSQHARSSEIGWMWTNLKHLVLCGLGKSIYISEYENSCYNADIVYLFSGCASCYFACYCVSYALDLILLFGPCGG